MLFPRAKILVFAKAPVPGKVKTRLIPYLDAEVAASLHADLVRHTLATVIEAKLCDVVLWCAPDSSHSFFKFIEQRYRIPLYEQQGEDLGQRMANAFEETLADRRYAVIIGTDCPTLTKTDLYRALEKLNRGADAVIAPARDGGYVLIGLRRTYPSLFNNIAWGSERVFTETRQRATKLGLRVAELNQHWDVDRPEDYEQLRESGLLKRRWGSI